MDPAASHHRRDRATRTTTSRRILSTFLPLAVLLSAGATAQEPQLELLEYSVGADPSGTRIEVAGRVRNTSGMDLQGVFAEVTFLSSRGGVLDRARAIIAYDPLEARQASPFTVTAPQDSRIGGFDIAFVDRDGREIPLFADEELVGDRRRTQTDKLRAMGRAAARRNAATREQRARALERILREQEEWWPVFDERLAPLRDASATLDAVLERENGLARVAMPEIEALQPIVLDIAKTLPRAPDPRIQGAAEEMLKAYYTAVEHAKERAWMSFQVDYTRAKELLEGLDSGK